MAAATPAHRALRTHSTPVLLAGLLLLLALALAASGSPVLARIGIGIGINVVLVVGLFVFIGNSGVLSFGHMGFVAIGAYTAAWLTMKPMVKKMMLSGLPVAVQNAQVSPLAATFAAGAAAACVALVTGAVIMRLSGIAAAIATLAFLAIVNTLIANADTVTGGTGSLAGIPTDLTLWVVLGWAVAAIVIAHLHATSAAGLALRAVREDEPAAKSCGVNAYRARLIAYVASAFLCGIAGDLQARFLGVVSPDAFYISATFLALTMLIVGGISSLSGAVFGVLAVGTAAELLARMEGTFTLGGVDLTVPSGVAEFIIAIAMCVVLVKRPQGLAGAREWTLPRRLGRPSAHSSVSSSLQPEEQNP